MTKKSFLIGGLVVSLITLAFTIYGICAGWTFGFIFLTPFIGYFIILGAVWIREGLQDDE